MRSGRADSIVKKCPCCNWESNLMVTSMDDNEFDPGLWWCECPCCHLKGAPSVDATQAVRNWNRRVGE